MVVKELTNGYDRLEGKFEGLLDDIKEIKRDVRETRKTQMDEYGRVTNLETYINHIKENKQNLKALDLKFQQYVHNEQKWRIGLIITFVISIVNLFYKFGFMLGGG